MSKEGPTEGETEQRLAEANARVARAEAALDELAHAVSHDLRAPLRAISTFSEWLERDLKGKLTGETSEYMRLLRSRTNHLESLINGMLQFARADRVNDEPERVDVAALVRGISESIGANRASSIVCDWLPSFQTQRAALERVLTILIDNALRFGTSTSNVRVGARELPSHYEFYVSDNGPGIPERLHERVWLLFQSAQPPGTEGSTGVGLAIARKVVERRGGRIWIDAAVTNGATFRFTWPRETQA